MPDAIFAHQRLARVYDAFDGPRDDLTAYVAIAGELGADRVLDVGCGTGCLAIELARTGRTVVGVDPAAASLEVARAKEGSDAVTWIRGDAAAIPPVAAVNLPLVSFRYTYTFLADGAVITSDSTLRFRGRDELESSLVAQGYRVLDVRDAPDRPGREFVFITERTA